MAYRTRFHMPVSIWIGFILFVLHAHASSTSQPISIVPSQSWDGNDGSWSSFEMQVGSPAQNVRVLPSSSGSSLWVVLPEGCPSSLSPGNCASSRGLLFNSTASTSWAQDGIYALWIPFEGNLGYQGNSSVGFDEITFGWQGSGGPTLNNQVVTGIADPSFWLGMLGLTPRPVNISSFNDQHESPLGMLRNQSLVPSSTWGYTAGASYRGKGDSYGSLIFGGYDRARTTGENITVDFGLDISRDLLVGLQGIESNGQQLLPDPVYAMLDSAVSHIWLPVPACQKFEEAFGLVYDDGTGLYLVNDTLHDQLLSRNASITFQLGASLSGGLTTSVTLPYSSFDLTAKWPLLGRGNFSEQSRYFPLRRASNDSQYALGRTFLQESYLFVDYDRSNFTIGPAAFPSSTSDTDIVSVFPPGTTKKHGHISNGAIAGIVVGVVVFIIILVPVITVYVIKKRPKESETSEEAGEIKVSDNKPELEGDGPNSVPKPPGELESRGATSPPPPLAPKFELEAPPAELSTTEQRGPPAELPSTNDSVPRAELPSTDEHSRSNEASEIYGREIAELPG